MQEIWKDIKGYEGLYQVSNLGRVKSLERTVNVNGKNQYTTFNIHKKISGKIIKIKETKYGYNQVCLQRNNNKKYLYVHRLVAQAFLPNLKNKPHINHIDCDKNNNNVTNLEWVNPKENVVHSIINGGKQPELMELYTEIKRLKKENEMLKNKEDINE